MTTWMRRLSDHYERMRRGFPEDELMILFDIDGTILDSRHMICHTLKSYDREHGTAWFAGLAVENVTVSETQVETLLESMNIGGALKADVLAWYARRCWTPECILGSHRPFAGVMDVIRWFKIQPRTHVALNTGRPEAIRGETLRSLNDIGREYRVDFPGEHLFMNRRGWGLGVAEGKAEGIRRFREAGYRVIAFVDNEPENLRAVAEMGDSEEILLLHARTIFRSKRTELPERTVAGQVYDITELVPEKALPRHVQLVWHGVNDTANLKHFLASAVAWAECDVRLDSGGGKVVLRDDSFEDLPPDPGEPLLCLEEILESFRKSEKSLKLDLKENGKLLDRVVDLLKERGLPDGRLWFNGMVEVLRERGFRKLAATFPGAVIQCPIDFLVPLILAAPSRALTVLDAFHGWGVNRFSINWKAPEKRKILAKLERWGYELNIYSVPDLQAFLQAVLLLPRSVTSDFNFPKWNYHGHGPGLRRERSRRSGVRTAGHPAS